MRFASYEDVVGRMTAAPATPCGAEVRCWASQAARATGVVSANSASPVLCAIPAEQSRAMYAFWRPGTQRNQQPHLEAGGQAGRCEGGPHPR